MSGALKSKLSSRSSTPPCPGRICAVSFAPALRFSAVGDLNLRNRAHFLATAAWKIDWGKNLVVKPSILAKSDGTETQIEISTIFRWRDNIVTGASFRGYSSTSKDAAVILAGLKMNDKIFLAYSFDVPLSALRAVNRGSHEIILRYTLNKPIGSGKLPPIIYNPRFN